MGGTASHRERETLARPGLRPWQAGDRSVGRGISLAEGDEPPYLSDRKPPQLHSRALRSPRASRGFSCPVPAVDAPAGWLGAVIQRDTPARMTG